MKVLILANPASSHTIKWVNSLSERGIEIYLFGLNDYDKNLFKKDVTIEIFNTPKILQSYTDGSFSKVIYLASLTKLKDFIKRIKPDILHAHYISSYGILGALTGFHPYFISVWGTDIYYVPERNRIYRKLIEFSLNKANKIFSTSKVMALQTNKFTNKRIEIIPFGIDTEKFRPMNVDSLFNSEDIVIGTVKTLERKYGIEYLIRAFKAVKDGEEKNHLKLLIVGGGFEEKYFKELVNELELESDTIFTGFISPDEISKYHNMIDIFVALSVNESFGVSVLEASACSKPVVVSDAEGFKEIIEDNLTGFVVSRGNINQIVKVLKKLINDKNLREKIGNAGRENVLKYYCWHDNVSLMTDYYNNY